MTKINKNLAVKIAKDVLDQLEAKRYVPKAGIYCKVIGGIKVKDGEKDAKQELRKSNGPVCKVCALGAAFVSSIRLKNEASLFDLERRVLIYPRLRIAFSKQSLRNIESVFEGWGRYAIKAVQIPKFDSKRCQTARIKIIMENIVRNNGVFRASEAFKDIIEYLETT